MDLVTADTKGIIAAIDLSIESICFENWHAKLAGYGSDSVSVNFGKKTILQINFEWIIFGWCVAQKIT